MDTEVMFSNKSDDWRTPSYVYNYLDNIYDFDDDPCPIGAKDGLDKSWGNRVFVNPPYSNIKGFLEKAINELEHGATDRVVFLVPSRTDTKWFQDLAMPYATRLILIKGRLRFGGSDNSAPFPSCIIVLEKKNKYDLRLPVLELLDLRNK